MSAPGAPAGWLRRPFGTGRALVAAPWEEGVRALALEPHGGRGAAPGTAGRRGPSALLPLGPDGARLHLRPLRHGGWLAPLLRDRFPSDRRARSEILANDVLRRRGAPVPEPVVAVAWRRGAVVRAAVGTVHVEGATDGLAFLSAQPEPERLLRAAAAAGRALRRFHDAGGRHADLQVANVLLREEASGTRAWLVDLDRARVGKPPGPGRRLRELARLHRSLVKRGLAGRVGARGRARFLAAYTGGDRSLRRALLRQLPRERVRLAVHVWGYRVAARARSRRSSSQSRKRSPSATSSPSSSTRTSARPTQEAGTLPASFSVVSQRGASAARSRTSRRR